MQAPLLDNEGVHTNQRLNNITRAMVAQELTRVRAGNGRPGFSESAGKLMFTDRDGRGQQRTREVLALEDRDAAFQEILDGNAHPGLGRFHQLVEQAYAGIGRRKSEWWYRESANNQLHSRIRSKSIVRPVTSQSPLRHLQCDLTDHRAKPSGPYSWCFNAIDLFSRYLWVVPMRNKEGVTCARALLQIAQQANLRQYGSVLQSDNDPSFESDVFQDAVRTIGLKHVRSKTYTSTSQAKVERVQQTVVRNMVGKWKTATGRENFHTVLPQLVKTYNNTVHSVIKVEPAVALRLGLADDQDLLQFVRANDFRAAKKLMGVDQHPLNVGDRCRVSVFAISSEARRLRGDVGGRKASQETNWSRAIFTVRNRSSGTALARPEYRLQELGYGKKRPIFYRHELLGPIDVDRLRDDVAKPPPKDQMGALETDALIEIEREAADAETAEQIKQAIDAPASTNDTRFLNAKVKKTFSDGVLKGKVVRHVMIPLAMVGEGDVAAGERWLVRYENNKEQLVTPQELLDILVAEPPKAKAVDPLANDPLLGRQIRAPEADDPDVGIILSVVLKKPAGKKKRTRHYTVEWRSPDGQVTLVREYERFEVAPFLI